MRTTVEATLANSDGKRGWLVWDCWCHEVIEFDTWLEAIEHATHKEVR